MSRPASERALLRARERSAEPRQVAINAAASAKDGHARLEMTRPKRIGPRTGGRPE